MSGLGLHLRQHTWSNLIWQTAIAVIFICVVLFFMNHLAESDVLWAVGAGSLSSSCFIVFGKPSSPPAMPYKIVGGYIIGILSGILLHFIAGFFHDFNCSFLGTVQYHVVGMMAALAIGLCLIFMSLFRVEHPPAAGMALVLVIDMKDYNIIFVVLIFAIALALIRRMLRRHLIDLT